MNIDLSLANGFPLFFDKTTFKLFSKYPYKLEYSSRNMKDLVDVFFAPSEYQMDDEIFFLYHLKKAKKNEIRLLEEKSLKYGFTILPPKKIGNEFVKTHGHSHPNVEGYDFSLPELYSQIYGNIILFLQKHKPGDIGCIEKCYLIKMKPGDTVLIPPNHAHMQINISKKFPSVTAGLFCGNFLPEFDFYKKRKGFAYYICDSDKGLEIKTNMNYLVKAKLEYIDNIEGTQFENVDSNDSLWNSFLDKPDLYDFLSNPKTTAKKFGLD
jgi:oxalate decarboxylase/phosphoglucose isomerase-like protein (cupin superfamily)